MAPAGEPGGGRGLRARLLRGGRRRLRRALQRIAPGPRPLALAAPPRVSRGPERVAIYMACPRPEIRAAWGDYHFAVSLGAAFGRLGVGSEIHFRDAWYDRLPARGTAVLALRGVARFVPPRGWPAAMWVISHPERLTAEECRSYGHVFCASAALTAHVERLAPGRASTLLQCTDAERFRPPAPGEAAGPFPVLFVGNSRGVARPVVLRAAAEGLDLSVYGEGWEGFLAHRFVKGGNLPNTELYRYYGGAGVLLNDHWPSMRAWGIASNRIFDGLACGARVLSDSIAGLPAPIAEAVAMVEDGAPLGPAIAAMGAESGPARAEIAARIRAEESFDARARAILSVLARA